MTETLEQRDITTVLIDPENERLFTRMDDTELDLLAASIGEVGMIQPITIRADGRIIAGEQRYRAALRVGLATVPVIVREDISESDVEKIRIHENLMRRGMKPSEQAKGIARLYELNGIEHGGDGDSKIASRNLRTVAEQIGWTVNKTGIYHTLAHLIEPLQRRWDAGGITRDVAYQVAQLPESQQWGVESVLASAATVPGLHREIAEYKRAIVEIEKNSALPPSDRERLLDEELVKLRLDHARQVEALQEQRAEQARRADDAERKLSDAERWADADAVHRAVLRMGLLSSVDPEQYVERLQGFDALTVLLTADLEIAEGIQEWLQRYAYALRERLRLPQQRLKGVHRATS